jgi:transposase
MAPPSKDPKVAALAAMRCLNSHPQTVTAEPFVLNPFFDARDLVQVKYEMVRRVRHEGVPVTVAVAEFGFSRPTYYQAVAALDAAGPAGLVPGRPGPKGAHKLTPEVMDRVTGWLDEDPRLRSAALAERINVEFDIQVHPRSVERALARRTSGPKSPAEPRGRSGHPDQTV